MTTVDMETYQHIIMSSVWFLQIERVEGGCRVILHDRLHIQRDRARLPTPIGVYETTEDENRVITAVTLWKAGVARAGGETLTVVNPKHVFQYDHFPEMPGSNEQTLAELAELAKPVAITRENIDQLLDSGQLEVHMENGNWWACRRNGATRRWKRDKNRIYVPIKYGFKFYGNITEADFTIPNGEGSFPKLREDGTGRLNSLYFRVKPPAELESMNYLRSNNRTQ